MPLDQYLEHSIRDRPFCALAFVFAMFRTGRLTSKFQGRLQMFFTNKKRNSGAATIKDGSLRADLSGSIRCETEAIAGGCR